MKTKWCGLDFEECGISGDLKKNLKEMPIAAADHEMPPGQQIRIEADKYLA